jgi:hypothetical protein
MTARWTALPLAILAATSSGAAELQPGSGYSLHLARFDGSLYYTVQEDGYRVVATLASGAEDLPIRFVSTLAPGQQVEISVPQAAGEPEIALKVRRDGDLLLMSDLGSSGATAVASPVASPVALRE